VGVLLRLLVELVLEAHRVGDGADVRLLPDPERPDVLPVGLVEGLEVVLLPDEALRRLLARSKEMESAV